MMSVLFPSEVSSLNITATDLMVLLKVSIGQRRQIIHRPSSPVSMPLTMMEMHLWGGLAYLNGGIFEGDFGSAVLMLQSGA
ncbi:unnamed protein product [Rodentolepis nana]|uniref:Uncharacterized protein n=1 Tax=Rodentolepis nana TaxID=102285 RepID=A0A3P7STP5_RODNA|nr:unnamed protein product [Rodentolepis nana]